MTVATSHHNSRHRHHRNRIPAIDDNGGHDDDCNADDDSAGDDYDGSELWRGRSRHAHMTMHIDGVIVLVRQLSVFMICT